MVDKPAPRWFVRWWPTGLEERDDVPVPYGASYETLQAAIEKAQEQIEHGLCDWVKLFHDTEDDTRLRWTKEKGYEHTSVYVRDYLKGLISS